MHCRIIRGWLFFVICTVSEDVREMKIYLDMNLILKYNHLISYIFSVGPTL